MKSYGGVNACEEFTSAIFRNALPQGRKPHPYILGKGLGGHNNRLRQRGEKILTTTGTQTPTPWQSTLRYPSFCMLLNN
jgi:hypothetical protein